MEEDFEAAWEVLFRARYEEVSNFVNSEKEKSEGLCKKTQAAFYRCLEEKRCKGFDDDEIIKPVVDFKNYSSGRKARFFDEYGYFDEGVLKEKESKLIFKEIVFCVEEIESYSKSYRIISIEDATSNYKNCFVKIFDFKPPKL